jgi:hypothetical protein
MGWFRRLRFAWVAAGWLAAGAVRLAAEPVPPELPFPAGLPAGMVRGTLTVWTEESFFHRVSLSRAMFPGELDELAERLRKAGWSETSPETDAAAAERLAKALALARAAGAGDAAQAVLEFFASGNRSWSLGTMQLLYLAGEGGELLVSFPFGGELACPTAAPGEFAAEASLPLAEASFVRRSLQAERAMTVATEQWASGDPPERFFDRANAQLLGAGWRGGVVGGEARGGKGSPDAAFSALLGRWVRVYERPGCQLTLLRTPGGEGEPAGYAFIARFLDAAAFAAGAQAVP